MVEVTQEDIRCALNHLGWDDYEEFCEWALSNHEMDRFDDLTQAFARHRIAAFNAGQKAMREAAAKVAGFACGSNPTPEERATAQKAQELIRNLKIGEE